MKTYSAKPTDVVRAWHVLDASAAPIGKVAALAATLLNGKHKAQFTSHIDTGDFVIIINTDKLIATGKKDIQKSYYRATGYPGNLHEVSLKDQKEKDSTKVFELAIRGMLPVNKLRPMRLARLKLYKDEKHNHEAQKPTAKEVM
jgi:large subunit ribosomal protein L13